MSFFNYCPKCSSTHIQFENNRRLECLDCGMVYFHNVASAVAVILEKEGKVLFTIRNRAPKTGKLDLPGGFTDPDESAEQTCSRELKEELNLDMKPSDFHYFISFPNDYDYKGIPYKTEDLIFTAQLPDSVDLQLEKSEIQAVKWIKKSEIDWSEIGFDSLRKAIQIYIEKLP